MPNNIYKTNSNQILKECNELIMDLQNNHPINESILKKKYKYLYNTSKTLFHFIIKEINSNTFNSELFYNKLNTMLHYITEIQNNKISQHNASTSIGNLLASEFIPSKFLKN